MRDANGNAAQTGGLARQVRQRMNRLCKPEHRARFCFFSKKKSLAGTRRFPIPSKSRFGRALTAAHSTISNKRLCGRSKFSGFCLSLALPDSKTRKARTPFGVHPFWRACLQSGSSLRVLHPLTPPARKRKSATISAKTTAAQHPLYAHASRRLRHHTPSNHRICRPHRIKPLRLARSIAPGGCLQRNARSRASTLPLVACPYGGRISAKTARRFSVRCINATVSPG